MTWVEGGPEARPWAVRHFGAMLGLSTAVISAAVILLAYSAVGTPIGPPLTLEEYLAGIGVILAAGILGLGYPFWANVPDFSRVGLCRAGVVLQAYIGGNDMIPWEQLRRAVPPTRRGWPALARQGINGLRGSLTIDPQTFEAIIARPEWQGGRDPVVPEVAGSDAA